MSDTQGGNGRSMDDLKARLGLGRDRNAGPPKDAPDGKEPINFCGTGIPRAETAEQDSTIVDKLLAEMPEGLRAKIKELAERTGESVEDVVKKLAGDPSDLLKTLLGGGASRFDLPDAEEAEAVLDTVADIYDQEIRPLVNLAAEFAPGVAKEVAGIATILGNVVGTFLKETRGVRESGYKDRAWSRGAQLKAYLDEGFTRAEAIGMIMRDQSRNDYALRNGVKKAADDVSSEIRKLFQRR